MSANAGSIIGELGLDFSGAEDALNGFQRLIGGIGAGINLELGRRLVDFAGDIATAGIKAANFAGDFDRSMIQTAALLPPVVGGAENLRHRIEELGKVTPIALGELSAGLLHVARVGAPNADAALESLASSAKLTRLSGIELNQSIELLDHAMDAFRLPASQAADVVDAFAVAAKHGVNADELAPILERVGAQASAAGIKLTDTVAAITALVESGVPVRQAGAIFTQSLGGVVAEGDDASVAASRLGIKLSVVDGHLRFAGRGADIFAESMRGMQERSGEADRQLLGLSGTLHDQQAIVRNELLVAWADFGRSVTPLLLKLTQAASGFLDQVTGKTAARDMAVQLRDMASGWALLGTKTEDAAHTARNAAAGTAEVQAAVENFRDTLVEGTYSEDQFKDALKEIPATALPELARALRNLSGEQRDAMGVTEDDIHTMLHLIGLAQQTARAVAAAKPKDQPAGKAGPVTPPMTTDLEKAIHGAQMKMGSLDTVAAALGPTFNRTAAEADILRSAISGIAEAGGKMDTVVGRNGETLGDWSKRLQQLVPEGIIADARTKLAQLSVTAKALGPSFDLPAARAGILQSAIAAATAAGATMDTVVGKNGETLADWAHQLQVAQMVVDVEAQKEQHLNDIRQEAQSVIEGTRTRQEAYAAGVLKLDEMLKNHLITLDQYNKAIQQLGVSTGDVLDVSEELRQGLGDAFSALGEAVGTSLAGITDGTENLGKALLKVVGNTMISLGHAMIAFGLAGVAIKAFHINPIGAIAAGVALIALGTALSKTASRTVSAGLSGGNAGAAAPPGPSPSQQQAGEAAMSSQIILEFADPANPAVTRRIVASANRLNSRDATPVVSVPLAAFPTD